MSRPEVDEVLFAYIAVTSHAVSWVLIWVDSGIQKLVYYVSKSLHEAEVRYLPLERAVLAVVHATRKLPHYFQSHTVVVLTQLPLRSLLRGIILGAFDIKYMPRTSVKGQVLADLVAEFTETYGSSNSPWPITRPRNPKAHWANGWPNPLLLRPMGSPLA